MSTEPRPDDELRLVVGALREHLAWQESCGGFGLPRTAPQKRVSPDERAEPRRPSGPQRVEAPAAKPAPAPAPAPKPPVRRVVDPPEVRAKKLSVVTEQAKACTQCPLHKSRKNVVYGVGKIDVEIMIVGEGPGADEDAQGVPFVGKAGQLLDKMLSAMGYDREKVYIANIVKCRPPDNRTPDQDEMDACIPYLHEQIALVQPKVIIAMGATAVRGLLGISGITRIRGRWKLYQANVPVMPTFHPAYLLRNEGVKRDVWNDLKAVLKHLYREVPQRR